MNWLKKIFLPLFLFPVLLSGQNKIINYPVNNFIRFKTEIVFSNTIYTASDFGFLPSSTAEENTTAFNSIPGGGVVNITLPGTYEIDGTLWLNSNTTYNWVAGDTLKKIENITTPYTHMMANEGIKSLTRNENIAVYGNGLVFIENSYELRAPAADYHMVGNVNLFKVDGFLLDGFKQDSGGTQLFFGHFADVNNFTISNMDITNLKAAFQFQGNTFDGTLSNLYTDTFDDALALNAIDYPIVMASVGNIERLTIDNWTDNDSINIASGGHSIRLMPGSWTDWGNGNTYNINDACNNSGNIYIRYGTDTPQIASDAPTHTSGTITGSDGIAWNYLQTSNDTVALITDITVSNSTMNTDGTIFHPETNLDVNMRSIYPGTEGNGYIDNIIIDNITLLYGTPQATSNRLFSTSAFTKKVSLINTTIDNDFVGYLFNGGAASIYTNYFDSLIIDNCDITLGDNASFIYYKVNTCEGQYYSIENSDITVNNQYLALYQQSLSERNGYINIENSTIDNMLAVSYPNNLYDLDVNVDNVVFIGAGRILEKGNSDGVEVNYTSNGATYSDPELDFLFKSNDSKFNLNTYSSIATLTQTTISSDSVVLGDVDLFTAPLLDNAIARVISNNEVALYFDSDLDTNYVPATSAFTVSGKTVSSLSITDNIVTLLMSTDFLTTDTPLVSYTEPGTNPLRGIPAGNVEDFTNESVYVWELNNSDDNVWYDFSDLATITTDGNANISKWANKSALGVAGDLIPEGDTAVYPDSTTDGVLFDGVDDFMIKRSFNINDTTTIYIVLNQVSWAANERILNNNQAKYYLQQSPSTPNLRVHNTVMISDELPVGQTGVATIVGGISSAYLRLDYGTKVSGTLDMSGTNGLKIGADASSLYSNVLISEMIFRDVADDDNYTLSMIRYLRNKWTIE